MTDWNAAQYLKYGQERTQPAIDLARRIPCEEPKRILDVGCGPGNSSQVLAERFPKADILGIDSSPAMVETARASHPDIAFTVCDAGQDLGSLDGGFDIVFSNACIQWIPDHPTLLANMLKLLRPGGTLAVQIPMNWEEPIHTIIQELTTTGQWKSEFAHPRIFHTLTQSQYFDLLSGLASSFSLWETTYFHVLASHEDILEWYRGTGLRPYLNVLSDARKAAFERDVLTRVVAQYPVQQDGRIIFRFPRFFFLATA